MNKVPNKPYNYVTTKFFYRHIPQNPKFNIYLNSHLPKELAKIILRAIRKISKPHLQLEIRKLQMRLLDHLLMIGKLVMNA
jgi:hypothetical protein